MRDEEIDIDKGTAKEIDKWLQHSVNRREFLRGGILALGFSMGMFNSRNLAIADSLSRLGGNKVQSNKLPLVTFGRTGVKVPILGLGSQTMGENQDKLASNIVEQRALEVYGHAMDNGVTFLDSAAGYKRAEEFVGKAIKNRERENLFITTKVWGDSYNAAKSSFEESLRRFGSDYVNLLYIHSASNRNIEHILKKPSDAGFDPNVHGAWTYFEEQKNLGRVKFLGITAHGGGDRLKHLVEHTHTQSNYREKVDAIMIRMSYVSHYWGGFHKIMEPLVKKYNLGTMIMKVFGGPNGFGKKLNEQELRQAVRYARGYDWAHGCVIGASSTKHIDHNIDWVNDKPLTPQEMFELRSLAAVTSHVWETRFAHTVSEKYKNYG